MSMIEIHDRHEDIEDLSKDSIKMTKRGEEIYKHLKTMDEELIENYTTKIV